jgi:hypothetical protein
MTSNTETENGNDEPEMISLPRESLSQLLGLAYIQNQTSKPISREGEFCEAIDDAEIALDGEVKTGPNTRKEADWKVD